MPACLGITTQGAQFCVMSGTNRCPPVHEQSVHMCKRDSLYDCTFTQINVASATQYQEMMQTTSKNSALQKACKNEGRLWPLDALNQGDLQAHVHSSVACTAPAPYSVLRPTLHSRLQHALSACKTMLAVRCQLQWWWWRCNTGCDDETPVKL